MAGEPGVAEAIRTETQGQVAEVGSDDSERNGPIDSSFGRGPIQAPMALHPQRGSSRPA